MTGPLVDEVKEVDACEAARGEAVHLVVGLLQQPGCVVTFVTFQVILKCGKKLKGINSLIKIGKTKLNFLRL